MASVHRMVPVYGYIVCIIAVITFLITAGNLVFAAFDLSDPEAAVPSHQREQKPSLASYEIYRLDVSATFKDAEGRVDSSAIPDEATLRVMYAAARADRVQYQVHRARRNVVVNSLLLVLSVVLFTTHWAWMRRLRNPTA